MHETDNIKREQLRRIALILLDEETPAHTLRPEIVEMIALLMDLGTIKVDRQGDIAKGETRTPNGLAICPQMAAMCAEDYVRTIKFIRGIHAAIVDIRKKFPDRPAKILYIGCGPLSTLAVPIMAVLPEPEAIFTLLDLHPNSIDAARSIVEMLGLTKSVEHFLGENALNHQLPTGQPAPDIILMEIMQSCLDSEPQVAVARHLLGQNPAAVMIPEDVRIDLKLVDPNCEFDLAGTGEVREGRIPLGTVFSLNKESIETWKGISTSHLPTASVPWPDSVDSRYEPMLFTHIQIYGNHVLKEYDSGLSYPKRLQLEQNPGNTLHFHYELGSTPGLRCNTNKLNDTD